MVCNAQAPACAEHTQTKSDEIIARCSSRFAIFVIDHPPVAKLLTLARRVLQVHLACIYVAAKNVEYVPYKRLLQTMLSHVHGCEVSPEAAAALELEVLQGLDWRLGPFFRTARRLCY